MTTASGDSWELRMGRWQDVLGDVECDALICDPPYSERTHAGVRHGDRPYGGESRGQAKSEITYPALTESDIAEMSSFFCSVTRHWIVVFSDHAGAVLWSEKIERCGWYVFAPVAWIREHAAPRFSGDGPASAVEYITVARPRARLSKDRIGSRPGYYVAPGNNIRNDGVPGGKPLALMRAIVRDYTRPGDIVCDPCAGGGTTLLAARMEGRRSIGAEMMPEHFEIARRRLAHLPQSTEKQPALFEGVR